MPNSDPEPPPRNASDVAPMPPCQPTETPRVELPEQLTERFYLELREMARRYLGGERRNHTLQPTALVNEAWIRLAPALRTGSSATLKACAALAMRRVLVDHARAKNGPKRGGRIPHVSITVVGDIGESTTLSHDLIDLDAALTGLAATCPRHARIVELHFFGGATHAEVAEFLGVSLSTVEGDWRFARAWLRNALEGPVGRSGP